MHFILHRESKQQIRMDIRKAYFLFLYIFYFACNYREVKGTQLYDDDLYMQIGEKFNVIIKELGVIHHCLFVCFFLHGLSEIMTRWKEERNDGFS